MHIFAVIGGRRYWWEIIKKYIFYHLNKIYNVFIFWEFLREIQKPYQFFSFVKDHYKFTPWIDIGIRFKAANMAQIVIHLPSCVSWVPKNCRRNRGKADFLVNTECFTLLLYGTIKETFKGFTFHGPFTICAKNCGAHFDSSYHLQLTHCGGVNMIIDDLWIFRRDTGIKRPEMTPKWNFHDEIQIFIICLG